MNQYDHLKNKLHNYKVEIDKEKLWAKTSHAIPQRKRRRAVLIMLFGGLVISAWLLQSTSLFPLTGGSSSQNISPINNNDQLAQNLHDNPLENRNEWNKTPGKTIEILSSKLSRSVAKLTQTINPHGEENLSIPEAESENTLFDNNRKLSENTQTLNETSSNTQNDNFFRSVSKNENINDQIIHSIESFLAEKQEGSSITIQKVKSNFTDSDRTYMEPVDYLYKEVSQIAIPVNTISAINSHKPGITPLKGRFLQSLQMVQGVGFSNVKIHSLTPESDPYATQLQQKMRSLEVLTTSMTATVHLPERFSLEAGVQFTHLSTVIDHEWESNERVQEEGVMMIIIDEHGNPQSIIGNRDITRTTHYQVKRFTTHQNIDFVLALHRVIWNEQRMSLNAFVKGAYNLSYDAKGTLLDNNGELVSFTKEENPFRNISPFSIGGGLQMMYQINPDWSLTGNFTYHPLRYQLNDEDLHVRFLHSGVSLGLGLTHIF